MKLTSGARSFRVDQHVRNLYRDRRLQWEVKRVLNVDDCNVLWFDFVEYDLNMIEAIIASNFTKGLNIKVINCIASPFSLSGTEEISTLNLKKRGCNLTDQLTNLIELQGTSGYLYIVDAFKELQIGSMIKENKVRLKVEFYYEGRRDDVAIANFVIDKNHPGFLLDLRLYSQQVKK